MSRGLRWTPEAMAARGWRDPREQAAANRRMDEAAERAATSCRALNAPSAAQKPRQRPRKAKPTRPAIPYERDVLKAVLAALRVHPMVAWAVRVNTGMAMLTGRGGKPQPVHFGFEGCPDIIGQISKNVFRVQFTPPTLHCESGAFLAIEVKRPGKQPTMEQAAFLLRVREAGGVAFVARSIEDIAQHLGPFDAK